MDVGLWDRLGYIAAITAVVFLHHRFKARWKRRSVSGTDYIGRAAGATLRLNLGVAVVTLFVWLIADLAARRVRR